MNQLLPLLSRFLPAGLAVKGISKVNPRMGKFITNAATAGYTSDSIMDFLRDKFQTEGQKAEKQRLQQGGSSLRPDEMNSLQKFKDQEPGKILPAAIGLATGLGTMGGDDSQALPQQQVPQQAQAPQPLAQPQPQAAPPQAQAIPQQVAPAQPPPAPAVQPQQAAQAVLPLAQLAPFVHQFIEGEIAKGRSPLEAAGLAKLQFPKEVSALEKKMGQRFSDIIMSQYAQAQSAKTAQGNQGQNNNANAQLMNAIAKLNQVLKP